MLKITRNTYVSITRILEQFLKCSWIIPFNFKIIIVICGEKGGKSGLLKSVERPMFCQTVEIMLNGENI